MTETGAGARRREVMLLVHFAASDHQAEVLAEEGKRELGSFGIHRMGRLEVKISL
jgi:hypothetical protein